MPSEKNSNAEFENSTRVGWINALICYGVWGLAPMYWKELDGIPVWGLVAHRIVWATVLFWIMLGLAGRSIEIVHLWRQPEQLRRVIASAGLIAINWLFFVFAVAQGKIVEASLGYFLNPIFSVFLGLVFLGERLRTLQWWALGLASLGVGYMCFQAPQVPWIALLLAGSFGLYGMVRKGVQCKPLPASTLEATLLVPFSLIAVLVLEQSGSPGWIVGDAKLRVLLLGTGVITVLPLLTFVNAVKRLPLSTMGFTQFLAPTQQLLLAVMYYDEEFTSVHLISFGCIWVAVALFVVDSLVLYRRQLPSSASAVLGGSDEAS